MVKKASSPVPLAVKKLYKKKTHSVKSYKNTISLLVQLAMELAVPTSSPAHQGIVSVSPQLLEIGALDQSGSSLIA